MSVDVSCSNSVLPNCLSVARLFQNPGEKGTIILGANGQIEEVMHLEHQFKHAESSNMYFNTDTAGQARLSKDGRVSSPTLSTVVFSIPCFCHAQ